MRILFATTAGAGHFGPMVPFAKACVSAGHDVQVAAPASFATTIEHAGLTHAPFPDAPGPAIGAVFGRLPEVTMKAGDELVIREIFGRVDAVAALPTMRTLMQTWRPDVVIREPAEVSSYVAAEQLGIPQVQVNIGLDSMLDRLRRVFEEPLAELGSTAGASGLLDAPRWTSVPASFDVAPAGSTIEPARFRDASAAQSKREPLPPWWTGDDQPLVYVTFGSVAASLGMFPGFYAGVLERLADAPVRVLLTLGEAGDPEALGILPPNAHVERWWPQAEVMPHVAAVVGHGGFGTTMLALGAGIPQVVVPLFAGDQYDNARRIAAVGAGIALEDDDVDNRLGSEMIPAGPKAIDELSDAVRRAIEDPTLRRVAEGIAGDMANLPDAGDCVVRLEEVVG